MTGEKKLSLPDLFRQSIDPRDKPEGDLLFLSSLPSTIPAIHEKDVRLKAEHCQSKLRIFMRISILLETRSRNSLSCGSSSL